MNLKIRKATADDMIGVFELMKELAAFQNMLECQKIDVKKLIEDGFESPIPAFKCFVAEDLSSSNDQKIVGYGLYCYSYSTWGGRIIFLNNLYVKSEYRKYHIGVKLIKTISMQAVDHNCSQIEGYALSWNPAMKLYEKLNAINVTKTEKMNIMRLQRDSLEKLIKSKF